MPQDFVIREVGLRAAQNDFSILEEPGTYILAHGALTEIMTDAFEGTQLAVPTDDGDYRRPAGALRDSGRLTIKSDSAEEWQGEIAYGTDDDEMPYAVWARWKSVHNGKPDYMSPIEDEPHERWSQAMFVPFDEAFRRSHGTNEGV